jgi:hypothetical protein
VAPAPDGANVDDALLGFQVGLVANNGRHIRAPAKELGVIARADDFFALVKNFVNRKHC